MSIFTVQYFSQLGKNQASYSPLILRVNIVTYIQLLQCFQEQYFFTRREKIGKLLPAEVFCMKYKHFYSVFRAVFLQIGKLSDKFLTTKFLLVNTLKYKQFKSSIFYR
jgi:hypothetical protein